MWSFNLYLFTGNIAAIIVAYEIGNVQPVLAKAQRRGNSAREFQQPAHPRDDLIRKPLYAGAVIVAVS